jgi:hypothetical protein
MEATNWQRPVDADGNLDVRVGDDLNVGLHCPVRVLATYEQFIWCTTLMNMGPPILRRHGDVIALIERNGKRDVPEDKRTGRWVASVTLDANEMNRAYFNDPMDRMVWLPDAVAPEPVRMDAPTDDAIDTFLNCVRLELMHALDKFPNPAGSMAALTEEVGEVAKALLDESQDDLYSECVQTAVVALWVAIQGDPSIDPIRLARGLEPSRGVAND